MPRRGSQNVPASYEAFWERLEADLSPIIRTYGIDNVVISLADASEVLTDASAEHHRGQLRDDYVRWFSYWHDTLVDTVNNAPKMP